MIITKDKYIKQYDDKIVVYIVFITIEWLCNERHYQAQWCNGVVVRVLACKTGDGQIESRGGYVMKKSIFTFFRMIYHLYLYT